MPGIEPKTFDFISKILHEVEGNSQGVDGEMSSDSVVMIFAGSFFEQVFGALGHSIAGFSRGAKLRAVQLLESVSTKEGPGAEARRIIAVFEAFCDLAKDLEGNYHGSPIRYSKALPLLERLLNAAEDWVAQLPAGTAEPALLGRIQQAQTEIGGVL